ncbi:hypothetical protein [Candidatus Palauibacter sp.]
MSKMEEAQTRLAEASGDVITVAMDGAARRATEDARRDLRKDFK